LAVRDRRFEPFKGRSFEIGEGVVDFGGIIGERGGEASEVELTKGEESSEFARVGSVERIGFSEFGFLLRSCRFS
jgi:hypothetical protein